MNKILKQLRKERKMTQLELSEKTGINQAVISKYESGERTPTTEKLIILADFYGVSVDYMIGRTGKREINQ